MSIPRKSMPNRRTRQPAVPSARRTAAPEPEQKQEPSRDRDLFSYLCGERGIPPMLILQLASQGLLRLPRDDVRGLAEFIDPEGTYSELYVPGRTDPEVRPADPDAFWGFRPYDRGGQPDVAYICGSAVEAISLYLCDDPCAGLFSPAVKLGDDMRTFAYYMPKELPRDVLYCAVGDLTDRDRVSRLLGQLEEEGIPAFLALGWDGSRRERLLSYDGIGTVVTRRNSWNEHLLLDLRSDLVSRLAHTS